VGTKAHGFSNALGDDLPLELAERQERVQHRPTAALVVSNF